MSGFLGAGDLYIDRLDDSGNSTGLVQIGNAISLAITEQSEIKERVSRMKNTYGQVLDSVPIKQPAKISMELNDLNLDNLALALLGTYANHTQAAVTSQVVNVTAKPGKWQELGYRSLTTVTARDATSTSLTEGTDFILNKKLGLIQFLESGANVTDDEICPVTVSAEALTTSGKVISGSTRPTIKAKLVLDGKNFTDGAEVYLSVWEAVLTPSSEVNFLSDDFTSLKLEGTVNTPTGKTSPYQIEYLS